MSELRIQNSDLRMKIEANNVDIRQKQLLLTQRENQHIELMQ